MNKAFRTVAKPENPKSADFQKAFRHADSPSTEKSFPGLEMISLVNSHPICEGIVKQNCLPKLFKGTSQNAL
jgi:hypothetical protein